MYLPNTCAMTNATKAASFDLIIAWESLSKSWGWLSTVCFVCEFPSIFLGKLASDFQIQLNYSRVSWYTEVKDLIGSWIRMHVKILTWKGLWSGTVVYVLEEHEVGCNETEVFCCCFHSALLHWGVIDLRGYFHGEKSPQSRTCTF